MAMAEWPQPGWDSDNPNSCQDVGNSILLLLGFIICINIIINMVTLLWSRLRIILHRVFLIICEKEAVNSSSPGKQTHPSKKESSPAVHLRCTMDPVKMTVTPPPTRRRHRRRASPLCRVHNPVAWAPDTDDEKPPSQYPAICSRHWDGSKDWQVFQTTQKLWDPWTQDILEPLPQTIRFQPSVERRPLKTEMRSELGLEAYVYPVNPPPPSPEALSHKNSGAGAEAEVEQCQPASQPFLGPANVPDIPQRRSSIRVAYDARDVRRRLRELTREVEALSHCYPLASGSSTAEGTGKDWVYRPLTGK
ncbi:spermatid maturation protein 1 [Ictidomys tridecemlineatus]|uniref:Spermatid maturation 1 n=1 Tax=Ictidomys tridecemlineatus TaxID=43179 RepID=A0A287D660_ICTTR|nr:spermatid maturation protein 1 [Ictidomys tridecemlineatus]KAG3269862.1 spermatid maturation protein 1 [Ictidomys tridecemlineatus]